VKRPVLGVDVGGVIVERVDRTADTSFFSDRYLETPPVEGAFEAIARLGPLFSGRVWLVSKAGPRTERRTREWLRHHRFEEVTGIPETQARFCRVRALKRPICDELGITHFVDDRLEVLGYLCRVPHRYLFRPEAEEVAAQALHLASAVVVESWPAAVAHIESTLPG
jgi:hypothetical protein